MHGIWDGALWKKKKKEIWLQLCGCNSSLGANQLIAKGKNKSLVHSGSAVFPSWSLLDLT